MGGGCNVAKVRVKQAMMAIYHELIFIIEAERML